MTRTRRKRTGNPARRPTPTSRSSAAPYSRLVGSRDQPATTPGGITEYAQDAGFTLTRIQELGSHYVTTLDRWAIALREHRDRAIELAGPRTYDAYNSYLTESADNFRRGHLNVMQFTCTKPGAKAPSPH